MPIVAFVAPVAPGKRERVLRTADEIREHLAEYEALNERAGLRRHVEFVQRSPMGDLQIVVYDTDNPAALARSFTDSEYDRWWVARLKDLYGVDVSEGNAPTPDVVQTWSWERPPSGD
jgi:hypothetical protein